MGERKKKGKDEFGGVTDKSIYKKLLRGKMKNHPKKGGPFRNEGSSSRGD